MRGLKKGKLLLGRFRATIPWLAKLRRRAPGSHGRHGRGRTPGVIMNKSPYFAEELIIRLGSRPLHQGLNLRLELVDSGVGVRPRIHERRFVERAHQGANRPVQAGESPVESASGLPVAPTRRIGSGQARQSLSKGSGNRPRWSTA